MMLILWPVDALVKVFPDDPAPEAPGDAIEVLAARGAVESAQCAVRVDADAPDLTISITPPRSSEGDEIHDIAWRRVEYVPVRRPAFCLDPAERLRAFPTFVPDPLVDQEALESIYPDTGWCGENIGRVPAGMTIPFWITMHVPADTPPGHYEGRLTVKCAAGTAHLPLVVTVTRAVLPAARTLKLTHWFSAENIAEVAGVPLWSDEHWRLLGLWGLNLAAHRANVILTPLTTLLDLSRTVDGALAVDFTRFDRWVETFIAAGAIGYIEGSHLAGRLGGWEEGFGLNAFTIRQPDGTEESLKGVPVEDPRAQAFLGELLPQLIAHLRERNWLEHYYQHLADEPVPGNAASYRALADAVRLAAPTVSRLDATMADSSLVGTVTVWCPQSKEAEDGLAFFQERQAAGEEVWHYTCLAPNGSYPNRFLNQSLLGTRVLHWFNFRAGLTGYLHWGFNQWTGFGTPASPHTDTESTTVQGRQHLPAGDTHLVYPGPGGRPFDSIRHEMVLEGVQDYELLCILAAHHPAEARALAAAVLPSLTEYERNPADFRAVRAELLEQVGRVQQQKTPV